MQGLPSITTGISPNYKHVYELYGRAQGYT